MSDHGGDSDIDPSEEINVDDLDSRSCSPRNYVNSSSTNNNGNGNELPSECSNSPPPSGHTKGHLQNDVSPRSHPFSISRLLGESRGNQGNNAKSPAPSDDLDSDKERRTSWTWEDANNRNSNMEDGRRSWGVELEEKMSEKDDDDTGSTPEMHTNSSVMHPADLLAPFRLFPGGSGLIYTGGGVIRVPAHRPPGTNGGPGGGLPGQGILPPWSLQALQHSQQQAAAAGLHRASLLANLTAHPLQSHPHLKDRLAGESSQRITPRSTYISFIPIAHEQIKLF